VRAACTGAAGVAALIAAVWAWRGGDWITGAGWAFVALIAAIASLAPWYLVWLLPLAALARGRALPAAALLATAYMVAVHLPVLGGVPWLSPPITPVPQWRESSAARRARTAVQWRGSINWTVPGSESATNTRPSRSSTATVFG